MKIISIFLLLFFISACQKSSNAESNDMKNQNSDLNKKIGWLHNNCLAIKNNSLESGNKVTVVSFNKKQEVLFTTIEKKTDSSVGCPQLNDDRKAINIAEGFSFYSVKPIPQEIDLGIVLVGGLSKYRETNSQIAADINNDGVSDYFTECSSSEGIHFNVWSEKPWEGKLLWSSYYYLGYDIKSNCPK